MNQSHQVSQSKREDSALHKEMEAELIHLREKLDQLITKSESISAENENKPDVKRHTNHVLNRLIHPKYLTTFLCLLLIADRLREILATEIPRLGPYLSYGQPVYVTMAQHTFYAFFPFILGQSGIPIRSGPSPLCSTERFKL